MSWKKEIERKLSFATDSKSISKELKKLCKDLLKGDTKFLLIYSSSRAKYITLRFNEKLGKETKKIILNKYGIKLFKTLNV